MHTLTMAAGLCSHGWHSFDQSCYRRFDISLSWDGAKEFCEVQGAWLVHSHPYSLAHPPLLFTLLVRKLPAIDKQNKTEPCKSKYTIVQMNV